MNKSNWIRTSIWCWCLLALSGCGARTGLSEWQSFATGGSTSVVPDEIVNDDLCPASQHVGKGCVSDVNEGVVGLCNDLDDDCDGTADEGCSCTPGTVKPCFVGPPLRRNVGACRDGTQACETTADQQGRYGPCLGGISPTTEICDNLDNDCNGCRDEITGCIPVGSCPGPGDSRIPVLHPFQAFALKAVDYYDGDARSFSWAVQGGPCDQVAPLGTKSFDLSNATDGQAKFTPRLSGDYTVTLKITALSGEQFRCDWVMPVRGPGLRIEMCYPESDRLDLDLYLKRLSTQTAWFIWTDVYSPNADQCDWHDCEAELRGEAMSPSQSVTRADWGYTNSPLSECINGPQGTSWASLGYCANPRLDIDNNLVQGVGLPENINVDEPRDGDGFRIMVQNFSGPVAHPIVNVYCSGSRVATFGAPPDTLPSFSGIGDGMGFGAMWRVADVVTHATSGGDIDCTVTGLHPKGTTAGYYVTNEDPSY
jgi:hypothetical protein